MSLDFMSEILLCVNLDHVATLRQARQGHEPSLRKAIEAAQQGGADGITVHLREDRRHIQDFDLETVQLHTTGRFTLEMAITKEMLEIACLRKPDLLTLVPEKRQELTTEGGVDICAQSEELSVFLEQVSASGLEASIFIDPDRRQIEAAQKIGAQRIELHTGAYADAQDSFTQEQELERLRLAAEFAHQAGFIVNAGHGLSVHNLKPILTIPHLKELHIGHAIIARAVLIGLKEAVREIKQLIEESLR
ncbi:MAG: pyridoxine 5'-phosphate synthase [Candidatus Caenarcaniphilales bacterium]|nr:pyridoxine 5'-phosphate synthase [Candidatus Caenarcaniphilales bacterium]